MNNHVFFFFFFKGVSNLIDICAGFLDRDALQLLNEKRFRFFLFFFYKKTIVFILIWKIINKKNKTFFFSFFFFFAFKMVIGLCIETIHSRRGQR